MTMAINASVPFMEKFPDHAGGDSLYRSGAFAASARPGERIVSGFE